MVTLSSRGGLQKQPLCLCTERRYAKGDRRREFEGILGGEDIASPGAKRTACVCIGMALLNR
jgi:hypothetical protein